jgi:hypothetical protein
MWSKRGTFRLFRKLPVETSNLSKWLLRVVNNQIFVIQTKERRRKSERFFFTQYFIHELNKTENIFIFLGMEKMRFFFLLVAQDGGFFLLLKVKTEQRKSTKFPTLNLNAITFRIHSILYIHIFSHTHTQYFLYKFQQFILFTQHTLNFFFYLNLQRNCWQFPRFKKIWWYENENLFF